MGTANLDRTNTSTIHNAGAGSVEGIIAFAFHLIMTGHLLFAWFDDCVTRSAFGAQLGGAVVSM